MPGVVVHLSISWTVTNVFADADDPIILLTVEEIALDLHLSFRGGIDLDERNPDRY